MSALSPLPNVRFARFMPPRQRLLLKLCPAMVYQNNMDDLLQHEEP